MRGILELDKAIDPGAQRAVRIGNIDLGQKRARAALLRIGDPGHLAGKLAIGKLWDSHDSVNARSHAEGSVLRHVDKDPDHVHLHDLEHEGAARGVALHQAANIDVALGDDAVERGDDQGVAPVLTELFEQVLLGGDVLLRGGDCGLVSFYGLDVNRALLLGRPALVDQRTVSVPGHLRKLYIGLRLLKRRFELSERCFVLRNLVIELRHRELRQHVARLDAIANIDVALGDITGRAGKDIRVRKCGGRARQGHGYCAQGLARPSRRAPRERSRAPALQSP